MIFGCMTVFLGISTYRKSCLNCGMIYRYQEWEEGIHNFDDHIILSLHLCLMVRNALQVLSLSLSLCLSVSLPLPVCLSPSVCLSVCLCLSLSLSLHTHPYIHTQTHTRKNVGRIIMSTGQDLDMLCYRKHTNNKISLPVPLLLKYIHYRSFL